MSDIFISYAREDQERAQAIAEILEGKGWSVWWDRTILPGRHFEEEIQKTLDQARCVVVLWSSSSVKSDWVKDEIAEAAAKNILVPALIEEVTIPLGYRRFQAANLSDWDGDANQPDFQKMLTALAGILADGTKARRTKARNSALAQNVPADLRKIKGSGNCSARIVSRRTNQFTISIKTESMHVLEYKASLWMTYKVLLDGKSIHWSPFRDEAIHITFKIRDRFSTHDADLFVDVSGHLFESHVITLTIDGQVMLYRS